MYPYVAGSHHPLAEYSTNEDGLIDENFHSGERNDPWQGDMSEAEAQTWDALQASGVAGVLLLAAGNMDYARPE